MIFDYEGARDALPDLGDLVEARVESLAADAGELVYRPPVAPALGEVCDHGAGRPSHSFARRLPAAQLSAGICRGDCLRKSSRKGSS